LILVDTGPLVALFDPADGAHERCVSRLKTIKEPICTTTPVLTEAFHLLSPGSTGCARLMQFIEQRGLTVYFLDDQTLDRAFELMVTYADRPMDFADASLVTAAEALKLRKVFTLDRSDFDVYRVKRGHRHYPFQVIK
jgi:predicted nucleic acid-binding protein